MQDQAQNAMNSTIAFKRNGFAVTGLTLGIASIFFYIIGILPILAIVFSGIGLSKVNQRNGKGKVQSWFGLILGIIYTIMYLVYYKHL